MRLIVSRLLAIASVAALAMPAAAATRPHYGGTLHVGLRVAPASLDPGDMAQADLLDRRNIARLLFNTLVTLDERGALRPALAVSWTADSGNRRWQLRLRKGVTFYGGTPLTADTVAASLRLSNPEWRIFPAEDGVSIQLETPDADLPAELALARNSIVLRESGKLGGTGAFFVTEWEPGKRLALAARDDYWGGRAFLDAVEITFGRNIHDQMIGFDLHKTQVVEVPAGLSRPLASEGRRVETSAPMELMALSFARDPQSADETKLRQALGLSIDRKLLDDVILQGGGEPAGGLLPETLTGYGFLFSAETNLALARQLVGEARTPVAWTLSYDAADPEARLIAERVALNARDAGLKLQLTTSAAADVTLVRYPLASVNARVALQNLARNLGLPPPGTGNAAPESLYAAERGLLLSGRVIPLLHLRTAWVVDAGVKNWNVTADGACGVDDTWLGTP